MRWVISFFFNAPATTEIYTLSLHDALPIFRVSRRGVDLRRTRGKARGGDARKGDARRGGHRRNHRRSEEHTSELQSLAYLVCRLPLEKKTPQQSGSHSRYPLGRRRPRRPPP